METNLKVDEAKSNVSELLTYSRNEISEIRELVIRVRGGSKREGISPEAACFLAELLDLTLKQYADTLRIPGKNIVRVTS